ncbi:12534_t:CDS:2 [Entrophospora sp. SA101]|nr:13266_t:CDS:2 [Entrophospora sp. SA101]CAJ0625401.1 2189_t:CDS:2 [Entrophospora sp. SA101]CAJ0758235.1 12534_t:CDS:2 [Entrophospora sp. SA101]CAJ0908262.1 8085_t:CDS:2 [Entrophospora sp. SA101]CAJ0908749.1 11745_t:CDS:2 [Entrophospora sp. SA101]
MKFSKVLFVLAVLVASTNALPVSDSKLLLKRAFDKDPVGGVKVREITAKADGTFEVNGSTFQSVDNAHQRQCDVQKNACFNKFNGGDKSFSGQDCEKQQQECTEGDPVFAKGASPKDLEKKKEEEEPTNFNTNPVGGVKAPKITENADGTFEVNGSTFQSVDNAHQRQCDVQKNLCFNKFNGGDKSFSGQDCEKQQQECTEGDPIFA